jgi:hypothetical protein
MSIKFNSLHFSIPMLARGVVILFLLAPARAEETEKEEKPKDAFVKVFNATFRNGVEAWETGLDLKFHNKPLANDVRVGEGGLVRQITYKKKDTVDVFRHREFLKIPAHDTQLPAAKIAASFDEGSMTLLVVYGEITPTGGKLKVDTIREFPVPEESRRPGMARLVIANFRQTEPVFVSIDEMEAMQFSANERREVFIPPGETEIFLIHKESGKIDYKRQLAVFEFKANRNYTGIILPAAEIPSRPVLRISDSNQEWAGIRSPSEKEIED